MTSRLEEKKRKIDEQIEKNLLKKKMLLDREKRKRASKFSEIGKLAYQANIDKLEENILLGAFLEIANTANDENILKWKNAAKKFSNTSSNDSNQVLCISFLEEPTLEIKKLLKERKFFWNRFRKEYHGKSKKSDIENLLIDCKFKIEEIID